MNDTSNTTDPSTCASFCNKLLRGEISAIESYQKAIHESDNAQHTQILEQIMGEHRKSVEALRHHVTAMGAVPDTDSGPWGSFAQTVTSAATVLGESTTFSALIQGEEHGIREYEEALNDQDVMSEIKSVFRDTLLPRLQKHVSLLKNMKQ